MSPPPDRTLTHQHYIPARPAALEIFNSRRSSCAGAQHYQHNVGKWQRLQNSDNGTILATGLCVSSSGHKTVATHASFSAQSSHYYQSGVPASPWPCKVHHNGFASLSAASMSGYATRRLHQRHPCLIQPDLLLCSLAVEVLLASICPCRLWFLSYG